ncbi:MAG TPA: protein kinase [Candidatus Polarisedimenticolia bacterium]|nr:protein kinase [Candidatus Polarisedimenticolia bacterium]
MTSQPTVLAGKYRLTEIIGRGGMGTVWRAYHLGFGAPVAVKLIDPKTLGAAGALRRFQNEARAAATLRSPHVVQVLDYGVDEATGSPFIAMELLEGESLAHRLRRCRVLPAADTARLVTEVARALSRAHEAGIVHRDLKPANIFLVRNEDEEIAKVLDFGTARLVAREDAPWADTSSTQAGAVIGTPRYMSPEQISGGDVDHRSDLWALAVIACECLTGTPLFPPCDIGAMVLQICVHPLPVPSQLGAVPAGFDEWFARATYRDRARRFPTARALADGLQRLFGAGAAASGDAEAGAAASGEVRATPTPTPTATAELGPITGGTASSRHTSAVATTPRAPALAPSTATTAAVPPPTARPASQVPFSLETPPSALEPIVRSGVRSGSATSRSRARTAWLALGALAVTAGLVVSIYARGRGTGGMSATGPRHDGPALAARPRPATSATSGAAPPTTAAPTSAALPPVARVPLAEIGRPLPADGRGAAAASRPAPAHPAVAAKHKRARGHGARAGARDGGAPEVAHAPEAPARRSYRSAPTALPPAGGPTPSIGDVLDQRR